MIGRERGGFILLLVRGLCLKEKLVFPFNQHRGAFVPVEEGLHLFNVVFEKRECNHATFAYF